MSQTQEPEQETVTAPEPEPVTEPSIPSTDDTEKSSVEKDIKEEEEEKPKYKDEKPTDEPKQEEVGQERSLSDQEKHEEEPKQSKEKKDDEEMETKEEEEPKQPKENEEHANKDEEKEVKETEQEHEKPEKQEEHEKPEENEEPKQPEENEKEVKETEQEHEKPEENEESKQPEENEEKEVKETVKEHEKPEENEEPIHVEAEKPVPEEPKEASKAALKISLSSTRLSIKTSLPSTTTKTAILATDIDEDDIDDEHDVYEGKGFRPFIALVTKVLNGLQKTLSRRQTQPRELIQRVLTLLQRCDNPDTAFRGPDDATPSSIVVQLIKIAELCCMPPAVPAGDRMPAKLATPVLTLFNRMVRLGVVYGYWPNDFVFFKPLAPGAGAGAGAKGDKPASSVLSFLRSLSKSEPSTPQKASPRRTTTAAAAAVVAAAAAATTTTTAAASTPSKKIGPVVPVPADVAATTTNTTESQSATTEKKVKKTQKDNDNNCDDDDENAKKEKKIKKIRTVDKMIEIVVRCGEQQHQDSTIQHLALSTLVLATTSERCQVHKEALTLVVKQLCGVFISRKIQANADYAKRSLARIVRFYTSQYEQAAAAVTPAEQKASESNANSKHEKAYLNDCLRLLAEFCALAKTELPKKQDLLHNDEMVRGMQTRVLGLEHVAAMVAAPGVALARSSKFVERGIKGHVCTAIVENGVSTNAKALSYTLKIFLSLMRHFKSSLKVEIGVFISNIFLRVLESPNSTLQQKWLLLKVFFHAICKEPLTLAELYINYDCDLNSPDVFVRMVNDFAKVAQGSNTPLDSWVTPEQHEKLRALSLECLVLVMESLMSWTEEGKEQLRAYQLSLQQQHKLQDQPPLSPAATDGDEDSIAVTPATAVSPAPDSAENSEDEELRKLREQKEQKKMLEDIRERWALDTKRALAYMRKVGVVDETPESLAKFLRDTDGLDKKAIGEFIGGSKPFNKDVLKAYVALFSFAGMELDEALRYFLGQFLLPGEGQVVDRIMENFGQRYYLDNAEGKRFEDADAVYKLSFAIIMLATDIHNPKVKNKLTFEQWEKMVNKDLAMGLDVEYLQNVFKRIAAKKLELVDDSSSSASATKVGSSSTSAGIGSVLNPRQRQMMLVEETSRWIENSLKKIQDSDDSSSAAAAAAANDGSNSNSNNSSGGGEYLTAKRIEYVEPIFESIWGSAVVALSILLESSEDPRVTELCLSGFRYGIHVAAAFFMETERSAFVSGLEKFTSMTSICEMRSKNIGAIRTLIGLAQTEGNYLQGSWINVLRCVSFLDKFQLVKSGSKSDFASDAEVAATTAATATATTTAPNAAVTTPAKKASPTQSVSAQTVPPQSLSLSARRARNNEIMSLQVITATLGIEDTDIDAIFTGSADLNDNAIVYFVKALCEVSLSEISSATPRNYSLQRIVEVATYNMDTRIRIVWSQIWAILQEHFIHCGCHTTASVSMYALDSLRQLSMRYLEKDELVSYNFQKEFLKPFEVVIATATAPAPVKEFIVSCLRQIVTARTANISSGWKTVFVILATCAEPSAPTALETAAFDLLSGIMKYHYAVAAANFFVELASALVAFGKSPAVPEISMRAVAFLYDCTDKLLASATSSELTATKDTNTNTNSSGSDLDTSEGTALITDRLDDLRTWFPILTGLASICSHPHIDVRSSALNTLFSILTHAGAHFSERLWELVFRGAVLPIFANVGYRPPADGRASQECAKPDIEWLSTSCLGALQALTALFTTYYDALSFLLPDLFRLFAAFLGQFNEALASLASASFFQFVADNAAKFSPDVWAAVTTLVVEFFAQSTTFLARVASAAAKGEFSFAGKVAPIAPTPFRKYDSSTVSSSSPPSLEADMGLDEDEGEGDDEKGNSNTNNTANSSNSSSSSSKKAPPPPQKPAVVTCNLCKTQGSAKEFLQCPMCGVVYYCSKKCQDADWPEHQKVCTYNIKIDPLNKLKKAGSGRFITLSPMKPTAPTPKKSSTAATATTTATAAPSSASKSKHRANKSSGISSSSSSSTSTALTKKVFAKCAIVCFVIKPLDKILEKHITSFTSDELLSVVDALSSLLNVVSTFITFDPLRRYTKDLGLDGRLTRTEAALLDFTLRFLFRLYNEPAAPESTREECVAEKHLVPLARELLALHAAAAGASAAESRVSSVILVLEGLYALNDAQYARHYAEFYDVFTQLIMDYREEIRDVVIKHFVRIGKTSSIC